MVWELWLCILQPSINCKNWHFLFLWNVCHLILWGHLLMKVQMSLAQFRYLLVLIFILNSNVWKSYLIPSMWDHLLSCNMMVCRFHLPGNQFWRILQRYKHFLITMPLQNPLFQRRSVHFSPPTIVYLTVRPFIWVSHENWIPQYTNIEELSSAGRCIFLNIFQYDIIILGDDFFVFF